MFGRVLIKALVIVVMLNAILLAGRINPVRLLVENVNSWWLVGHGRARLTYPSDFQNGQLPVEALLNAHAVNYDAKSEDEYRVLLLGESGIAGWGLEDYETLSAQLTALGIEVGGRQVVAYNLAYPQPGAARDLVTLDAALAYDPDLVIWFITPAALNDEIDIVGANRVFFDLNRARLAALVDQYPDLLADWYEPRYAEPSSDMWLSQWVAIRDQELLPIWLNALLYPFIPPDLAVSDRRIGQEPVPDEALYTDDHPGFAEMPNATWNILRAACLRTEEEGVELLLVNEPMLVGSGGASDINYNVQYQRAMYDRYRDTLSAFSAEHGIGYVDLWNIVPASRFTDTPLHMDAQGQAILADAVAAILTEGFRGSECDD